jgi:hypothetical protein
LSGGDGTPIARVYGRFGVRSDDEGVPLWKLMYPSGTRDIVVARRSLIWVVPAVARTRQDSVS